MMDNGNDLDIRARAVTALKKQREFHAHVAAYVLINSMLVVIWAMTGADFFWPIFPILGWGIGVFFNAWDVYGRGPSEQQIQRQIARMR